jgi:hypothetical protein
MMHYHKFSVVLGLFVLSFGRIPVHSQDKQTPFLLEHPELVELELLPRKLELNEDPEALLAPYTTASKIYFRIQATNTSLQQVRLLIIDTYVQDRPELFRDGQVVPHKKGMDELLRGKERDPFTRLAGTVKLEPNDTELLGLFCLDNWYGQLQPGHYQLSLKHRFEPGQDWIDSSSITFEVVPKIGE